MFDVGRHELKNGWILTVSEYKGHLEIYKSSVYGIWATRELGGQWGDGIWSLSTTIAYSRLTDGDDEINIYNDFTIECCNDVVDRMEEFMLKYDIRDYSVNKVELTEVQETCIFEKISSAIGIKKAIKKLFTK